MVAHTEGVTLEVVCLGAGDTQRTTGGYRDKGNQRDCKKVKPRISQRMIREPYGLETGFVCLMWGISERPS
jgi:hypothetical protein